MVYTSVGQFIPIVCLLLSHLGRGRQYRLATEFYVFVITTFFVCLGFNSRGRRASTKAVKYVDDDSEDEEKEQFTDDDDEDYYE